MGAQPPTIKQHKTETKGLNNKKETKGLNTKTETKGLNNKKRPRVSTQKEPLKLRLQSILCGQEAVAVASLLTLSTSSRTLRPAHDAWAAGLHMVEEMLRCLVELAVAATTEEGYPQMLPRMTIGCGKVLVHHTTIWAERYLLSLVVVIIDGHPGQAFHLVQQVNHILLLVLKWHIWGYDGYQGAISLSVEEWPKPDICLVTPALVYKGSHSSSYLKALGLHLAK